MSALRFGAPRRRVRATNRACMMRGLDTKCCLLVPDFGGVLEAAGAELVFVVCSAARL
jgi:hypothetical protein